MPRKESSIVWKVKRKDVSGETTCRRLILPDLASPCFSNVQLPILTSRLCVRVIESASLLNQKRIYSKDGSGCEMYVKAAKRGRSSQDAPIAMEKIIYSALQDWSNH